MKTNEFLKLFKQTVSKEVDTVDVKQSIVEAKTIGDVIAIMADEAADAPSIMYSLVECVVDDLQWSDISHSPTHYDT